MPPRRGADLVVALVGQPNCGKSTLFNAAAGFKVNTGNFAGTSVSYTETRVQIGARAIRLIDLPGTYSITSHDPAEKVARDFLLSGAVDVIVNVVDASLAARSLELTLQLVEMGVPLVVGLNMMDEARRKGITLDVARLGERLGVEVLPVVAVVGSGVDELFRAAVRQAGRPYAPRRPTYARDVEERVARLAASVPPAVRAALPMDPRFLVLRLLEADGELEARAAAADPTFVARVAAERRALAEAHGLSEAAVLGSHRHALVLDLYEAVATHASGVTLGWRERIDRFIMNPVGGAVTVVGSLVATFYLAFYLGDVISGLLDGPSDRLRAAIAGLGPGVLPAALGGLADGFVAGAGIVLPYLVPLLLLLAVYEDTGLLPRIAFLVDGLLHRVGLHGKSVVPVILGYGCNVPAIMATRNLDAPRDRLVTMLVIPFVTCSARSVVVIALAGKYLGGGWAAALYLLGLAIAMAVSFVASRTRRHRSLGVLMEVPPLRRPYPAIVAKKVWFRLREFLVVAWPVIGVSSLALALASYVGMDAPVDRALAPLTVGALRLPAVTGIALFLGVFRKELTLVMLAAALGGHDVAATLSQTQILVLVLFTMLYIPCVATLATLWKEGGWRVCVASAALNFGVAVIVAGAVAHVAALIC